MSQDASSTVVFGEALVDDFLAEQVVGGAPFNVARHLAAFMAPSLMITRIGSDRNGAVVRAEFERFAMSEAGLQIDAMEETGRVIVERVAKGQRFVILPGQAYDYIDADAALAALAAFAPRFLYFGTLVQRSERARETLYKVLEASAATGFLDLNLYPGQVEESTVLRALTAAAIVKVNEQGLQSLFSWYFHIDHDAPPMDSEAVRAACRALFEAFGGRRAPADGPARKGTPFLPETDEGFLSGFHTPPADDVPFSPGEKHPALPGSAAEKKIRKVFGENDC